MDGARYSLDIQYIACIFRAGRLELSYSDPTASGLWLLLSSGDTSHEVWKVEGGGLYSSGSGVGVHGWGSTLASIAASCPLSQDCRAAVMGGGFLRVPVLWMVSQVGTKAAEAEWKARGGSLLCTLQPLQLLWKYLIPRIKLLAFEIPSMASVLLTEPSLM